MPEEVGLKNIAEECKCVRWVVSLSRTFENEDLEKLFRKGAQCVTEEEHEKLFKLRHKEDALSALLGCLLLREGVRKFTNVSWDEITFDRTERGKPFVVTPPDVSFGVNISHQGNYVGLASSCSGQVGIDLMRLDKERNSKTADEYITSMAKSASAEELRQMRGQPTEAMKMTVFYRYWCLKESILKATGEGILKELSKLDFRCDFSERYRQGCFITSTYFLENGEKQPQWLFEESFIDQNHSVAVCKLKKAPSYCLFRKDPEAKLFFKEITLNQLLENAVIINPLPMDALDSWENLSAKLRRPF